MPSSCRATPPTAGWCTQFVESGFFDPKKPIKDYTEKERHDLLYRQTVKIKAQGINVSYDGLIPKIRKSMFSKDVDSLQPHIRAFVERAAVFKTCPVCEGTRLNEAARSSKVHGLGIGDVCAMQITDAAEWLRGVDDTAWRRSSPTCSTCSTRSSRSAWATSR